MLQCDNCLKIKDSVRKIASHDGEENWYVCTDCKPSSSDKDKVMVFNRPRTEEFPHNIDLDNPCCESLITSPSIEVKSMHGSFKQLLANMD